MARGSFVCLCAIVSSIGCASPTVEPKPQARGFLAGAEPVLLDVAFEDHLSWPYRLEGLLVVLDGAVLYQSNEPRPKNIELAHLSGVPPGDHTLQLLAKVRYSSGSLGDECRLTLRTARSFTLAGRAWQVRVNAHASDVTRTFSERVRLDVLTPDSPVPSEGGYGYFDPAEGADNACY